MYFVRQSLSAFALVVFSVFSSAYTEASPTSVFILGSGSSESAWTQSVTQGIKQALNQTEQPFIFYLDYLDAGRFDEMSQQDALFDYLQVKFARQQPDFFVSLGPAASSFSAKYPTLFSSAKRIHIQPKSKVVSNESNAVVIDTQIDYLPMIAEVLRLSTPETVYIVGDTVKPSDKHRVTNIAQALDSVGAAYQVIDNQPLAVLLEQVKDLPRASAIFFTPIYRQNEDKGLPPVQVLSQIHQVANVPIFATSVTELGYGAVGGVLHSPFELGMLAGEALINVQRNLPVVRSHDGIVFAYDWAELMRWGYMGKIDAKSDIRFKPPVWWETHLSSFLIAVGTLVVLLSLVIASVFYNRKLSRIKSALLKERLFLEKKVEQRTNELSLMHDEAARMARVDELTGISNRRAFFELGELIHNQAQRTNSPYSIVMLDIDRFKSINDTYGHAAGDYVVKDIADVLVSVARKSDVVSRIGGDEFAVILTNTPLSRVQFVAERVRKAIEESCIEANECIINTTVSMGVAQYKPTDSRIGTVLARADKALYKAKEGGKNKVVC